MYNAGDNIVLTVDYKLNEWYDNDWVINVTISDPGCYKLTKTAEHLSVVVVSEMTNYTTSKVPNNVPSTEM